MLVSDQHLHISNHEDMFYFHVMVAEQSQALVSSLDAHRGQQGAKDHRPIEVGLLSLVTVLWLYARGSQLLGTEVSWFGGTAWGRGYVWRCLP